MSKVNLNQSPYYDDFNEDDKYYQILFRPGRAVQARELTQIQTLIQKQIERMGNHVFEQGAQVLPGSPDAVKYVNNNGFIKIDRSYFAADSDEIESYWLNKTITSTSGDLNITAEVIGYRVPDSIGEARLFLRFISADDTGLVGQFNSGQTIETVETTPVTAIISSSQYATGLVSSIVVEEGVYYFNGRFVLVDQQVRFLEPDDVEDDSLWNNKPTTLAGLTFTESLVTSEDDEALLDNALGSPNYAAPGADRLRVLASLDQRSLNSQDIEFVPLIRLIDGIVQTRVVHTDYSVLEDTLARRTFDESGDYTVRPFDVDIKDFLRDEENRGIHLEQEYHYSTEAEATSVSINVFGLPSPGAAANHPSLGGVWVPGTSYNVAGDETSFIQLCKNRLSIKIEPGKAYVKGYEITKIATNVVDIERSRTLDFDNNRTVSTPLGTFIYITNVFGIPKLEDYDEIELYSVRVNPPSVVDPLAVDADSFIGTARVLSVDYFSGVNGTSTAVYRLFLFDIETAEGVDLSQLKSIYSASPTFCANVQLEALRLTGSVSSSVADTLKGTGTSWKNDENQRLIAGDYISVGLGSDIQLYRVTDNPTTDNTLKVEPDPNGVVVDGSVINYLYTTINGGIDSPSLIYKLPEETVYTIRGGEVGVPNPSIIDTNYTSKRVIADGSITHVTDGTGFISFTLSDINEEFEDFSPSDFIVINADTGTWFQLVPYVGGALADATASVAEVASNGQTLEIYTGSGNPNVQIYAVASVIRSGGTASKERSKTLVKGEFVGGVYSGPSAVSDGSEINEILLGKCDVLQITRIVESPDFATVPSNLETLPAGHKDITGAYSLDDGQRDYYYDIGRAVLLSGFQKPKGQIRIEFDYFQHGTTGNYFSIDSYPWKGPSASMDYGDIPVFSSPNGGYYDLRNCIDFRPRIDETTPSTAGVLNFSNYLEVPRDNFRCDYHFYEARIDKLYLDKSGKFLVKKGVPGKEPSEPADPATGMTIYKLFVRPYTATPYDCIAEMVDNRRYTMRDIGKIERRVKNLEYYTSLSLLESETADLTIPDALGQDKFKNGFMTDNFGSYGVSDLRNVDFRCAIDKQNQELRPIVKIQNCALFEDELLTTNETQREQNRESKHYRKTGDVYTLDYALPGDLNTDTVFIKQVLASRVMNVNPYAVFSFVGSLKISPWTDEWRDTNQLEPNHIKDESQFLATASGFGPDGTTTNYGATVNNWTGIDVTKTPTGNRKLIFAGHSDVKKKKKNKEKKEKDKQNPEKEKQGNKGSKGKSTQKGPGKKRENAHKKGGRQIVGGERGGRRRRRRKKR